MPGPMVGVIVYVVVFVDDMSDVWLQLAGALTSHSTEEASSVDSQNLGGYLA
jgi:hypothetical protein